VILDGQFELDNGIRVVGANGVAIENMTAVNYTRNGFFWTGGDGYRGVVPHGIRTGDYGVYAFDIANGIIEHVYASAVPDAGVYIGQCYPCNAIVSQRGQRAQRARLLRHQLRRQPLHRRVDLPEQPGGHRAQQRQLRAVLPQRETTIVGNLVHSNNNPTPPAIDGAILAMGNGILPRAASAT
jgi:hypothetical protein